MDPEHLGRHWAACEGSSCPFPGDRWGQWFWRASLPTLSSLDPIQCAHRPGASGAPLHEGLVHADISVVRSCRNSGCSRCKGYEEGASQLRSALSGGGRSWWPLNTLRGMEHSQVGRRRGSRRLEAEQAPELRGSQGRELSRGEDQGLLRIPAALCANFLGCGREMSCSEKPLPPPRQGGGRGRAILVLQPETMQVWFLGPTLLSPSSLPEDTGGRGTDFSLSPRTREVHAFS